MDCSADPFGNCTTVNYDVPYDLLVAKTQDVVGNAIEAVNDYRVLQPRLVTDPNGNRSAVAFDILGMVVGTAVMGKPAENRGDSLDGFESDLTQAQINGFYDAADPHIPAVPLLNGATTRIIYDLERFQSTQQAHPLDASQWLPVCATTLARETHVSEPLPVGGLKVQISSSYSDGFGREIQKKIQAEPGSLIEGGSVASPRWVGSGWTIFNNKGKPVRQYEPFFDDTHDFKFGNKVGVSPILFYDPVERVVATLHPNHTWEKVVFDPWQQTTYDVNDTVTFGPRKDKDVSGFFTRLPDADYLPGWYQARINKPPGDPERQAAEKVAKHADTATVAYFDTLGRTFLTIADNGKDANGKEQKYHTRTKLDIEGNQRTVIDAKDRIVMKYDYDMLGNRIHQASMDAGDRWMLNDVTGKPLYAWDSRKHIFISDYDELRRPTEMRVKGGDGDTPLDNVYEKIIYGEGQPDDKKFNLRGKPILHHDTAGKIHFEEYDFKGNTRKSNRSLSKDYKKIVHWGVTAPDSLLENETFFTETEYDALNRVIKLKTPDKSITTPEYNEANLLEKVDVLFEDGTEKHFVTDINYNEKGQRTDISYGNGIKTTYDYDRETFRLLHLQTKKANDDLLQDLYYTYDPVGNIMQIEDKARPTIFFGKMETRPVNDYTYDALYRLVESNGREHIGQMNFGNDDNWNDLPFLKQYSAGDQMAWRNYTQEYHYDEVGNIKLMNHIANGGSWKRNYEYEIANNRLKSTTVGSETYNYVHHPQHGFMTAMPHLQVMEWNFKDELQAVSQQKLTLGTPETTYYIYDSTGQRIRKVTENAAAVDTDPTKKEERIYVGGAEIYRKHSGTNSGLERITLHVMDDKNRIAMVKTRNGMDNDSQERLVRYQFSNHLGTACLETDDGNNPRVISYEEYHPYGSTSYQAVNKAIKAAAKRYRYTGKERDEESGLYYHGARYYAPWLGRWVSCDPIGLEGSINLFAYTDNRPTNLNDVTGNAAEEAQVIDRRPRPRGIAHGKTVYEPATTLRNDPLLKDISAKVWTRLKSIDYENLSSNLHKAIKKELIRNPKGSFSQELYINERGRLTWKTGYFKGQELEFAHTLGQEVYHKAGGTGGIPIDLDNLSPVGKETHLKLLHIEEHATKHGELLSPEAKKSVRAIDVDSPPKAKNPSALQKQPPVSSGAPAAKSPQPTEPPTKSPLPPEAASPASKVTPGQGTSFETAKKVGGGVSTQLLEVGGGFATVVEMKNAPIRERGNILFRNTVLAGLGLLAFGLGGPIVGIAYLAAVGIAHH